GRCLQFMTHRGDALVVAALVHPLGLLLAVLIALAIVVCYAGLAAFVALRVIVAAAAFGALYLLLVITHTLFSTISEQSPKGQTLAASLGISAGTLAFGGALLSAGIRVMLILAAFLLIIGPWEVSTADLFDTVRNIPFGFKIGELHLSFETVVTAAFLLLLLLVVTRIVQRWLETATFVRATVIIPNSEFITGVVKNWTRTNTLGRIVIKIGVAYDSDPIQVRAILLEIAGAHPQVVQSPPAGAFLLGFGNIGLEFELRCVVADVEKGLSVRSDLH